MSPHAPTLPVQKGPKNFFKEDSPRNVEGFRDGADAIESAMDFEQIGNRPNQSEVERLYNEALTAFADCTGLEAKRDDAIKNGVAKTRRLYEIVGPDNWEPLLQTNGIKRNGKAKGRFQPFVKHAMGRSSSGWVSKVASVLEEAIENKISAEDIAEWITRTPNGINGIYKLRSQRKRAEKRAAKGLPPPLTKEQKHLAYEELIDMDFISEHELPETWRDHMGIDPVTGAAGDAFEVVLAARFENGKFKVRGYFVPGSNFWIAKSGEFLKSRGVEPNGASSAKKNLEREPCAVEQTAAEIKGIPDRNIETETKSEERPASDEEIPTTLVEPQHSPPPTQGLAVKTQAGLSSTVIENRPPASGSAATEPRKIEADGPPVCHALGGQCIYATCREKGQCLTQATRGHKAWDRRIQHQIQRASEKGETITPQEARRRIGAGERHGS